jgi:hypothetical protein
VVVLLVHVDEDVNVDVDVDAIIMCYLLQNLIVL